MWIWEHLYQGIHICLLRALISSLVIYMILVFQASSLFLADSLSVHFIEHRNLSLSITWHFLSIWEHPLLQGCYRFLWSISAVVMRDGDGKIKCFGFDKFENGYSLMAATKTQTSSFTRNIYISAANTILHLALSIFSVSSLSTYKCFLESTPFSILYGCFLFILGIDIFLHLRILSEYFLFFA